MDWPVAVKPLLNEWEEQLRTGKALVRTRESVAALSWSTRERLVCNGKVLLRPENIAAWEAFLAGTSYGSDPFRFVSYDFHTVSEKILAALSPQISRLFAIGARAVTDGFSLGFENFLKKSEDFSDASVWGALGSATVTRTGGQNDPQGGTRAWRIQTSGGTSVAKLSQFLPDWPGPADNSWALYRLWIRNIGSTNLILAPHALNLTPPTYSIPNDGAWREIIWLVQRTFNDYFRLTFCAPNAGNSLDFFVFEPAIQMYEPHLSTGYGRKRVGAGSQFLGYVPTGATKAEGDLAGRAYVWAKPGFSGKGYFSGRIFAQQMVFGTEQGEEILLRKEKLSEAGWYKVSLLLLEV